MLIVSSTITLVGDFQNERIGQMKIGEDISSRKGFPTRELKEDTDFVLMSETLTADDHALISKARESGIRCITLSDYRAMLPSNA